MRLLGPPPKHYGIQLQQPPQFVITKIACQEHLLHFVVLSIDYFCKNKILRSSRVAYLVQGFCLFHKECGQRMEKWCRWDGHGVGPAAGHCGLRITNVRLISPESSRSRSISKSAEHQMFTEMLYHLQMTLKEKGYKSSFQDGTCHKRRHSRSQRYGNKSKTLPLPKLIENQDCQGWRKNQRQWICMCGLALMKSADSGRAKTKSDFWSMSATFSAEWWMDVQARFSIVMVSDLLSIYPKFDGCANDCRGSGRCFSCSMSQWWQRLVPKTSERLCIRVEW